MLVLTRKHQEKIRIGEDIVITILRTKGKAVRLGIEAPSTVPVIRGELAFETVEQTISDAPTKMPVCNGESEPKMSTRRIRVPDARSNTNWPSEANSTRPSRSGDTQVSLRRVPREKLAEVLPRLKSDANVLRSLLNQRSST